MCMHIKHATLAKIFIAFTLPQVGWVITRTTGISLIGGLEVTQKPQKANTLYALLAAFSVGAVFFAWKRRSTAMKNLAQFDTSALVGVVPFLHCLL